MPFNFKKIFFLLLLSIWLFPSCTGNNTKPVDADGILGKTPKAFYNTSGPNTTNVVLTFGPGQPGNMVRIVSGVASSPVALSADSIQISVDGTVLTIRGQAGIYEYSPVAVASIVNGSATAPLPAVDSFCVNLGSTGYSELQVNVVNGALAFTGLSANQSVPIGGVGEIVKSSAGQMVSYQKAGFGTIQIDSSAPSSTDAALFKAAFSIDTPNPWRSVSDMYCRLNNVPALLSGVPAPILQDAFTDVDGTDVSAHAMSIGAGWSYLVGSGVYISSNKATIAGVAAGNLVANTTHSDGTFSLDVALQYDAVAGILFRATDSNHYWVLWPNTNTNRLELFQPFYNVITSVPMGAGYGTTYTLTLTLNGPSIHATFNGSTLDYSSSYNQTATLHGIRVYRGAGASFFPTATNFLFK